MTYYREVGNMMLHTTSVTLTLSRRNSGLMKSSRNQVSGGFSQSAMDLVDRTRGDEEVLIRFSDTLST